MLVIETTISLFVISSFVYLPAALPICKHQATADLQLGNKTIFAAYYGKKGNVSIALYYHREIKRDIPEI